MLAAFILKAQDGETRIGIREGITLANIYGADVSNISSGGRASTKWDLHLGVFVNSKISRKFWIKSEVVASHKTIDLRVKDKWDQQYRSYFRSLYIDVFPVSPTFLFHNVQLFAGPYLGILVNSSIQQKDSLGVMSTNRTIFGMPHKNAEYRQKLDAGFVTGIEYEFDSGISIGVRYVRGFVPLFENISQIVTNPSGPPPAVPKIFNQALSISIGYSFGSHQKTFRQPQ